MSLRYSPDPVRCEAMSTEELRQSFLLDTLFASDRVSLVFTDLDRAIVGSAVPATAPLALEATPELRAATFCERRELGVLNVGGPGTVTVDGEEYALAHRDGLYVGRGSQSITFASESTQTPARFYLLSFPAHASHPTRRIRQSEAEVVQLGSQETCNRRALHKLIHPGGSAGSGPKTGSAGFGPKTGSAGFGPKTGSCQLVMGYTVLEPGSVWNTMPPHTHERRMEVYLYFDLMPGARVFHFMGRPDATRHLVVSEGQAVLSPSWSIHSGVGTGAYSFCWGMGGENQAFDDMDPVTLDQLR